MALRVIPCQNLKDGHKTHASGASNIIFLFSGSCGLIGVLDPDVSCT